MTFFRNTANQTLSKTGSELFDLSRAHVSERASKRHKNCLWRQSLLYSFFSRNKRAVRSLWKEKQFVTSIKLVLPLLKEKVRLWSTLPSTFSFPTLSLFSFSDFNLKTVQNLFFSIMNICFSKNLSSFICLEQKLFKRICLPMINFTNKNCFTDTLRSP